MPQLFFKVGKVEDFPKELEKWKIFRFIGNFSTTANIPNNSILEETCRFFSKLENFPPSANVPIHLILLEKFPPSPIGLKIGKLENFPIYWKIFRCFQIGKISTFCKFSNSSDFTGKISIFSIPSENWKTGKFSDLLENFPIYWKIFSDVSKLEKFPPSANFPILLILLEKFPTSPIGLKIGTLSGPDNLNFAIFEKIGKVENFPTCRKNFLYCKYSNSSNFGRK